MKIRIITAILMCAMASFESGGSGFAPGLVAAAGVAAADTGDTYVVDDGLVSYWKFGNVYTTTDLISSHNGTIVSALGYYTGCDGVANGTYNWAGNNYISVGDHTDFSFGNSSVDTAFSLSVWIRPYSTSTSGWVCKRQDSTHREYYFYQDSNQHPTFNLVDESTDALRISTAAGVTLVAGTWYHVVMTYTPTGNSTPENGVKIYVNGVSKTITKTSSGGTYAAMENLVTVLCLGDLYPGSGTYAFGGQLDEARVYDVALTVTEVGLLYAAQK